MNRPDPLQQMMITTGGLGFMRPASGTWGSLPPVVLGTLIVLAGAGPTTPYWWVYSAVMLAFVVAFSAACIVGGDDAEAIWGKDPSPVVADETAGMALLLLLMPPSLFGAGLFFSLSSLAGAFVLFRALDIAKLPPAYGLQRFAAGWGILLDDLVAALQGVVLCWVIVWAMA